MAKFILIGLCEPISEQDQPAFDEWFINQHIEDTTRCPNFIKGGVYELSGPHLDLETKSKYISIYEVEAPSCDEAERILNEWQANPEAWAGRANHMQTMEKFGSIPMKINGSGWYKELKVFKSEELKEEK